jgi:DNA-binding response OmpR family regulator
VDKANVLLIEGKSITKKESDLPFSPFMLALRRKYQVFLAHDGDGAIKVVEETYLDVVVLDSASMHNTGNRICQMLRKHTPHVPIIHILQPANPAQKVRSNADVVLHMPFTSRKLMNRVEQFLSANRGATLAVGPFKLDFKGNMLTTHKGEYRLTPKTAALLDAFLRHPNEVLERSYLMSKVWDTDYLGDTRTLDVHIRWIRQAVEENPGKPVYIKTVRGVGYLLDLKAWQADKSKKS